MPKILVVDDTANIRELINKTLSPRGQEVTTVGNASQALEVVFSEPFDLVILDIDLGQESGLSVLKKIREKNFQLPVVIYSGCVTADIETEARTLGATDILRKDIGMTALVMQIERILRAKDRISQGLYIKKETPILVVDDNANIRVVLRSFFEKKGYQVLEAEDGGQALEIARKNKISAVLLDIEMPVMNGLETLPKLLEINPKLGIVMATGMQDDESVRKAIEMGAYGYVLKPFDFLYLELVVMSRMAIAEGA